MLAGMTAVRGRSPAVWLVLDAAVTVALLAASTVEIFSADRGNGWAGPRWVECVVAVVAVAPVVARRRAPVAAFGAALAAAGLAIYLIRPGQAPLEPFIALVLLSYSAGAFTEIGKGAPVVGAAAAGLAAVGLAGGNGGVANTVPAAIWLVCAWAAGSVVRSGVVRSQTLARIADRLERDREHGERLAVALERARIARELHDIVAHNVSVMTLHAQAGNRSVGVDGTETAAAFSTIETVGRQTVDDLRRLLGILREDDTAALEPALGLAHLDDLVGKVRAAGMTVELAVTGPVDGLPAALDVAAYRIIQEALTNALKHGSAPRASVSVESRPGCIEIAVENPAPVEGHQIPRLGHRSSPGHGLIGMRERVQLYAGRFEACRTNDDSFRVHAVLPFPGVVS